MIYSHGVIQVFKKLSNKKASGSDYITAEHPTYASARIAPFLAICFTGFMIN